MASIEARLGRAQHSDAYLAPVADFFDGLFHGAVENPINGGIQVANKVFSAHLPELHLVDEQRLENSAAGRFGTLTGSIADLIALSYATGGIARASPLKSTLGLGAIGAAYGGFFVPTDANSSRFWTDRLENAGVAASTVMAGSLTSHLVERTGLFTAHAQRGLLASMAFGIVTGGGSGLGYAESNALFREHKLAPSYDELARTESLFMTLGGLAALGGYVHRTTVGGIVEEEPLSHRAVRRVANRLAQEFSKPRIMTFDEHR